MSSSMQENYFYSNGKKVSFRVLKDKMPVRFKSESAEKNFLILRDAELQVDTAFNFRSVTILQREEQGFIRTQDTASVQPFVLPASDLVSVIKLSNTNANLILTNRIVARFKPEVTKKVIDSLANAMGCKVIDHSSVRRGRVVFECDGEEIIRNANQLFESNLVEFAHPDFISELEIREPTYFPNDPMFKDQWHLSNTGQSGGKIGADISAPLAWEISQGSPNVVIAFLDDAFDINHEDLKSNFYKQKDFSADPPDDNVYSDIESHGTNVLGVAVAKGGNNIGVTGSCPNCRFMAIRALDQSTSKQAAAFDYAVSEGAWIISNSWGYSINSPTTDDVVDAINNAATNGRNGLGCVIFFAMTNTNEDNCAGDYPDISSLESVIAISRSTNLDRLGGGGYGSCMELIAPTRGGTLGITTTDITGDPGSSRTNYYSNFSGTSSATPLVAGVAGLMLSVNDRLSSLEVRDILIQTADKIDSVAAQYDRNGFSNTHGYGRVNAHKALKACLSSKHSP